MKIGYQGEGGSYSARAAGELFPGREYIGYPGFAHAFNALDDQTVERLVLPIENSTTGSVLPVLDRLTRYRVTIIGEHLIQVRHALIGLPGTDIAGIRRITSHPQALAQAEDRIERRGWEPIPAHDTAGAVRRVAAASDPTLAALAPPESAAEHGLAALAADFMDRDHNTTRFVVLTLGDHPVAEDADKTSFVFATAHTPGALALALAELGLRGANLTHLESRPGREAWKYYFYADMLHPPGPQGVREMLEPPLATVSDLRALGTYRAADLNQPPR